MESIHIDGRDLEANLIILNMKDFDVWLPLMEFTDNNSYHVRIEIAPYKALYGSKCRSPIYWDKVEERKVLGSEIIQQTNEVIRRIREKLRIA